MMNCSGKIFKIRFLAFKLLLILNCSFFFTYLIFGWNNGVGQLTDHEFYQYDVVKEEPIDVNQDCFLPQFHPFHPSILKYIKKVKPISCRKFQPALTFIDDEGILRFNESAFGEIFWSRDSISCEYSEVLRDNSDNKDTYLFNTSKPLKDFVDVTHVDFIKVTCKQLFGMTFYYDIHSHIRRQNLNHKMSNVEDRPKKFNVLMFGLDSISRLNAMRQFPKTFKYMKDVLGSVILRGYLKVGGNTFPNLASLLTGYHPHKEPHVHFPMEHELKPHDPWPFIWKNYSASGYRTLFAEDLPFYNAFHYMSGGFRAQPTDHYLRTFWEAAEKSSISKSSSYLCFGNYPKHIIHMNYVKKIFTKLHNKEPIWAFSFLTELAHDYINLIFNIDTELHDFVKDIHQKGFLNDTFFFLFADHGQRFDGIRATHLGGIEDKMPLMMIHVPERFAQLYPDAAENLRQNQMRLTTPYDIYCTLSEILSVSTNSNHILGDVKTFHGTSLFGKVLTNRTCLEAGVDEEYCTCTRETGISTSEPFVLSAANHLIKDINDMLKNKLKNFDLCAKLTLTTVTGALYLGAIEELTTALVKIVKVSFKVSPSGGHFEGTVEISGSNSFKTKGEIERINRYGNQPWCIKDNLLRVFCYCY